MNYVCTYSCLTDLLLLCKLQFSMYLLECCYALVATSFSWFCLSLVFVEYRARIKNIAAMALQTITTVNTYWLMVVLSYNLQLPPSLWRLSHLLFGSPHNMQVLSMSRPNKMGPGTVPKPRSNIVCRPKAKDLWCSSTDLRLATSPGIVAINVKRTWKKIMTAK